MSEHHWLRRRWKLVLNLVTLGALLILIFAIRDQLGETFINLAKVHAWALLLMIPIQLINYHAQTKMYQNLFAMVGNKLNYKYLYKAALELNFVNHVFPSGGVTGVSYFSLRLKDGKNLTAAKATLVQFMKLMLMFLSFEILLIVGLFSLAIMGKANDLVILVAGSLATLLLVGTIGFFYMLGSRKRIDAFFTGLTKALNKIIQIVRPKYPETINVLKAKQMVSDFHENYVQIKRNWRQLQTPFWYALLANVTEVAAIYVVFIAFGDWVNVGAVILAYAIANFAGLISVLPGGIGIYEALMVTTLASTGVPARISVPVIVMYRVLNTIIQVPPGYYLYHKNLQRSQPESGSIQNG